jgi:hypothetical protein
MYRKGMRAFIEKIVAEAKDRKESAFILAGLVGTLAEFQIYFFRELLSVELRFGFLFVGLLMIGAGLYVIGMISERGLDLLNAKANDLIETHRASRRSASRANTLMPEYEFVPMLAAKQFGHERESQMNAINPVRFMRQRERGE